MKTKNKITVIALLSTLTFSTFLKADEVLIPIISKPAVLEEGTQKELTEAQIAELLPWAKDSKLFLTDLLDNTQGLPTSEKIDRLLDGLKQVVGESAPKNSELFMRYVLNRAILLIDLLEKEMDTDAVGTADVKTRVLVLSIKMAIKYYDADMAKLTNNKNTAPYASFGIEYFNFLTELNKSIFDASAEYNIQRISFEWLQWDLYRDLNNATYASKILKINNALKTFPSKKLTDTQSISYIRQMKKVSQQLDILSVKKAPNKPNSGTIFNSTNVQKEEGYPLFIEKNELVFNVRNHRFAKVISQDTRGFYIIKYMYTIEVQDGWSRDDLAPLRGCNGDICVGTKVYNIRNGRFATVRGIQADQKYVLSFSNGETGPGWIRDDLAIVE